MSLARVVLWIATLAALALALRALWVDIVPGAVAAGALVVLVVLVVLGVRYPEWEMFGSVRSELSEARALGCVVELGPAVTETGLGALQAMLERHEAHVTLNGDNAALLLAAPQLAASGHELAISSSQLPPRALWFSAAARRVFSQRRAALPPAARGALRAVLLPRRFGPPAVLDAARRSGLVCVVAVAIDLERVTAPVETIVQARIPDDATLETFAVWLSHMSELGLRVTVAAAAPRELPAA